MIWIQNQFEHKFNQIKWNKKEKNERKNGFDVKMVIVRQKSN